MDTRYGSSPEDTTNRDELGNEERRWLSVDGMYQVPRSALPEADPSVTVNQCAFSVSFA
jgi:hypothetical protein